MPTKIAWIEIYEVFFITINAHAVNAYRVNWFFNFHFADIRVFVCVYCCFQYLT